MRRALALLAVGFALPGLAVFLGWIARGGLVAARSGDDTQAPWSNGPAGHLLAGELIAECLARPVTPWRRPYTELNGEGVLVCFLPAVTERPVSVREARAAVEWLARRPRSLPATALPGLSPERANALILFCDQPNAVADELGLLLESVPDITDPAWTAGDPAAFAARGLPPTPFGAPNARVRLDELRHRLPSAGRDPRRAQIAMLPLYARGEHIQVGLVACGYGTAIVVVDPRVATNKGLFDGDNARLVVGLVGLFAGAITGEGSAARPVWIDEYHHGRADDPGLSELASWLLTPALWHGLFVMVLVAWRLRARLGRPVEPEPRLARERIEFLWAKADLHRAHRHSAVVTGDLRRRLAAALRRAAPAAIGPQGELLARERIPPDLTGAVARAMRLIAALTDRVPVDDVLGLARNVGAACRDLEPDRVS